MTLSRKKGSGILIEVQGDKTLSRKSSQNLASSLKKQFKKYAGIMSISARKMDSPQKGYGLGIEVHGDTSWSYVLEVRDAARAIIGKDVQLNVNLTNKYPAKSRAP
ncbi:MAG: hypothetical protein ACAH83_15975 [Alphaproteobacteria bacterium]